MCIFFCWISKYLVKIVIYFKGNPASLFGVVFSVVFIQSYFSNSLQLSVLKPAHTAQKKKPCQGAFSVLPSEKHRLEEQYCSAHTNKVREHAHPLHVCSVLLNTSLMSLKKLHLEGAVCKIESLLVNQHQQVHQNKLACQPHLLFPLPYTRPTPCSQQSWTSPISETMNSPWWKNFVWEDKHISTPEHALNSKNLRKKLNHSASVFRYIQPDLSVFPRWLRIPSNLVENLDFRLLFAFSVSSLASVSSPPLCSEASMLASWLTLSSVLCTPKVSQFWLCGPMSMSPLKP